MENHNQQNQGGASQQAGHDPNATRFFPAGSGSAAVPPEAPQAEIPRQSAPPQPQQGYAPPYTAQMPPQYQPVQPVPPVAPRGLVADKHERDRTTLGLVIIGVGLLFFISQFSTFGGFGDLFLLFIGGGFLYSYFRTKPGYRIGFLIPGAILTGIGVGQVLENTALTRFMGGEISAFTLGLGFCSIWFFERKHWWSLIPGTILILSGLSSMYVIGSLWPLILIGFGVYLLYGQSRRK